MNKKDEVKFSMTMKALGEAFQKEVSPLKIEIYFKALQDLPIDAIEQACWNMINTRVLTGTFPMVAEIRNAIQGNPEEKAIVALEKLERAVREIGGYNSIVFDDPVIHQVVASVPDQWIGVCNKTLAEWEWFRKDFTKLYQAFMRNKDMPIPLKLVGRHDQGNAIGGHHNEPEYITYFGDRDKIEAWQAQKKQIEGKNAKILKIAEGIVKEMPQ